MPYPGRRRVALASLTAIVLAALVAALPAVAPASSFDSTGSDPYAATPNNSAGDQYVETLPTTKGPRAADKGKGKHVKKLDAALRQKLAKLGGSDAATLSALATSPGLGAPGSSATTGKSGGAGKGRAGHRERDTRNAPAVPSAAINAVDGGDAGLGWLVLGILAITGLALGALALQRHRDKGSTGPS
jgi:hypothetical protein